MRALIGVGAGFLSEVIQKPMRRDASWEDVAADCVGVLLALALYALFDRRSEIGGKTRAAALLIVAGCLTTYLAPVVSMVRAYVHRDGQFPVLANFNSRDRAVVDRGLWHQSARSATGCSRSSSKRNPWPGFSFHEPVPDWRRFKALVVDVENPDAEPC